MDIDAVHAHQFSKKKGLQTVDYVIDNEARSKKLINLMLTASPEVAGRSSWSLSYCAELRPNWIRPHIGKLIRFMEKDEGTDATKGVDLQTLSTAYCLPLRAEAPG